MNRPLTIQEKRTIRIAAICIGCYLVLFYGFAGSNYFSERRADYAKLVQQARDLRDVIQPYEEKIGTVTNLMDRFRLDPSKLEHSSVVAQASAAIQQAAAAGGVGVGPIRETPGRLSAKEAGSIQFEGNGPVPVVLGFLHNLDHVGFPVIVDSVQFTSDPRAPNGIKVNLTIVVLDFDAWKAKSAKEEIPNA